MNAVIYARYSSEGQREESIDGQIRECMEYCKQNGMNVVQEYIDRALSAKTDNRPDFQRMIKDSAKGLFDVVVVWKLDRFARNRYDSAHYKAALKKNGVRVISAKENIADGPEGIILESMLEGMAEYYSAELSVKVIRGHTENALKCKYNGGTPTFGFAIDANKQYQPDPVNAPIVLDIFKMYDTGSTMKQIVDHLNALGVTTVRGKSADLNFISGILHNRKYIGEYKYRDIVVPDGIPALVPTDLFERVQEQMKKNKKAPARHKAEDDYLLTTKLFCGSCKAMMVGESGTSSSKGQVYHYYRCVNSKRKKTCKAKHRSVRKDPLERAVVASVMRNIMDDAFVEYFTDQALALQGQESNELPALRRQLADTEKAIDNMLNAIQAGIFNASTKRRLDELEATKEKLELSIIKEEMKKPQFTREQIQFYILQFRKVDTNTLEGRRRLIDGFVNSVVVYDDYILVTFNYKEGAERITFEQIERSDLSSLGGPQKRTRLMSCPFLRPPRAEGPLRSLGSKCSGRQSRPSAKVFTRAENAFSAQIRCAPFPATAPCFPQQCSRDIKRRTACPVRRFFRRSEQAQLLGISPAACRFPGHRLRQLPQEGGWLRGGGKDQLLPGTSQPDEEQAPLLLHVRRTARGLQRQRHGGEAGQEHRREFQPLGAVERHQPHGAGGPVFPGCPLEVRLLAQDQGVPEAVKVLVEHRCVPQPLQGRGGAVLGLPLLHQLPGLFGPDPGQPFLRPVQPGLQDAVAPHGLPQGRRIQRVCGLAEGLGFLNEVRRAVPQQPQGGLQRRAVRRLQQNTEKRQGTPDCRIVQKILPPGD